MSNGLKKKEYDILRIKDERQNKEKLDKGYLQE